MSRETVQYNQLSTSMVHELGRALELCVVKESIGDAVYRAQAQEAGKLPGKWVTRYDCDDETIAHGKSDRLYRICSNGPVNIEIKVDGKVVHKIPQKGECTDVEGKEITVHQIEGGTKETNGSYDNLT